MASYMQTTIHSKVSKVEKTNGEGTWGRIIKGSMAVYHQPHRPKFGTQSFNQQIEESSRTNGEKNSEQIAGQAAQFRARKMPDEVFKEKNSKQLVLFESEIFPAVYFKKTTMRSVLKEFIFPSKCKALPPNDERTPLTFQIIANLFNEIVFYVFNLLVAQDPLTKSYYVFFSDSETIPFTKCCQSPVHIEMQISGMGKIMCNSSKCPHPSLAQFLIGFEDGRKLWKNMTFLSSAPQKDQHLKHKIARFIRTGKYKSHKLDKLVEEASREVEDIFEKSKFDDMVFLENNKQNQEDSNDGRSVSSNFITNPNSFNKNIRNKKNRKIPSTVPKNNVENQSEQDLQAIVDPDDKNVDLLKVKIYYMAKKQKGLTNKFSKSIVEDSKVFHKRFQMIEKIDQMIGGNNSKYGESAKFNKTKINFPKIMDQIKTRQERKAKSMSRTQGKSFTDK